MHPVYSTSSRKDAAWPGETQLAMSGRFPEVGSTVNHEYLSVRHVDERVDQLAGRGGRAFLLTRTHVACAGDPSPSARDRLCPISEPQLVQVPPTNMN
ncbi:hypothetical protein CDL15_Pgr026047 [Punica granatum]|uniref:Uncharacterized protein n=1 Tax=Punica granatum TaxID=22663 RepID=A0A218WBE5_PUNGR|nr:hypothetical protein CDL15_Pgr026047 [Punica granatum]PKI56370.1 hypothetical protein CRG98_023255 [Punica granatum]